MRGRIAAQILLAIVVAGCGGPASREYTSPEGRFRVQFPGKPKLVDQPPIMTPLGPVVEKFAATDDWSHTVHFVSYFDYPLGLIHPGNEDSMLDDACQGWAAEKQLTILSKGSISVNGHPGREVSFEARPGSPAGKVAGRSRFYLVGGRLYHVGIVGPTGKVTTESIDQFINSFALLDQGPGRPTVTVAGVPTSAPRSPMGFYTIPEPAFAALVADRSSSGMGGVESPALPGVERPAASTPATAAAGGASIRSFEWVDEDADLVGGHGGAVGPDGNPDQHLGMVLELPPNTIVEELVVTSKEFHRWVTRPNDRFWAVGIFQKGRPVARTHVAQVGVYSGTQKFDLYVNSGIGIGPGSPFEIQVVVSIAGNRLVLGSHCQRPEQPSGALAGSPRPRPAEAPRQPEVTARPAEVAEVRPPSPRGGRESTEVPVFLKPSSGGASIVSFDWLDQKEDRVSGGGRTFEPGGGKDEHFRLALDLPPAALLEEIVITGGGVLRWTTKPSTRFWPVAVFAEHRAQIRGQSLKIGTYSGPWTFDLYVESHNTVRPDQVFGVEVVVMIKGTRHSLTARCQRK